MTHSSHCGQAKIAPMKNPISWLVLVCALSSSLLLAKPAPVARFVPASITLNGKVLFEAATDDNGQPDADQVWEYLATLQFSATDAFDSSTLKAGTAQLLLRGTPLDSEHKPHQARDLKLAVTHGGEAMLRELKLMRFPEDPAGGEWRVAPEQIKSSFNGRRITRRQARLLTKPKRKE